MEYYIIRNEETGEMLAGLLIEQEPGRIRMERAWTQVTVKALKLSQEEAQATIQFINDVIDWELAQQLTVEQLGPCIW